MSTLPLDEEDYKHMDAQDWAIHTRTMAMQTYIKEKKKPKRIMYIMIGSILLFLIGFLMYLCTMMV